MATPDALEVAASIGSGDLAEEMMGWRYVDVVGADGKETSERETLTLYDWLYPRVGDVMAQNEFHGFVLDYLKRVLRPRVSKAERKWLYSDVYMDFRLPSRRPIAPDIIIVRNRPKTKGAVVQVDRKRTELLFVMEVMSPTTATNDTEKKVAIYRTLGIPMYVIAETVGYKGPIIGLTVYTLVDNDYRVVAPDEDGRYYLPAVDLRMGLNPRAPYGLEFIDARTGESADPAKREQREKRALRLKAERESRARKKAEQELAHEAQARRNAEQEREKEARARRELNERVAAMQRRLAELGEPNGHANGKDDPS